MFQVIFNEISASEMAALPKVLQLELLDEFQVMPEDTEKLDKNLFGKVTREGRTLHRYRSTDYRIYFERQPDRILVHRVLHKNTIRDFLYRSNLPLDEEDENLGNTKDFWRLIHEADQAKR